VDSEKAFESVRHLFDLGYQDPNDVAAHRRVEEQGRADELHRAESLLAGGRLAEAVSVLEQLAELTPGWPAPHRLLAPTYYVAHRFDDARQHLDWLRFRGIESAQLAELRARVELGARNLEAALDQANYARDLDEQMPGIDALIGDVHRRRGRLDDAEQAYHRELTRGPGNAAALSGLAALCLRRGDCPAAVDWALQALEQDFRLPLVHYRLGIALAALNRPEEAITALETAVKLRPHFAAPFRWMTEVARRQFHDPRRAAEYRRRGQECLRARRSQRAALLTLHESTGA
jgi:tetratricopeptide (TPR) repeat protein